MDGKNTMSVLEREGKRLVESLGLGKVGYKPQYLGEIDGKQIFIEMPTDRYFVQTDVGKVLYNPSVND